MPPRFRRCGFHFHRSHAPISHSGLSGRKAMFPRVYDFDLFSKESRAPKPEPSLLGTLWHCTLPSTVSLGGCDFAQQAVKEVILSCHSGKEKKAQNACMVLSWGPHLEVPRAPQSCPAPPYTLGENRACPCQLRQHICHQESDFSFSQSNMALTSGNIILTSRGLFFFFFF